MTYTCYSILMTGDLINGITCVYTSVLGYWFYAIMMLVAITGMYFKSHNVTFVAVMGIISGFTMASLFPPEIHQFGYVMVALALTGVFYKVFKG